MRSAQSGEDIRKLSRSMHGFAVVSLVTLAILIAVNHAIPGVAALLRPGEFSDRFSAAGVYAVRAIPFMLFASCADRLRRALRDYADGRFFEARAARLVSEAGQDVAGAIVALALIVPNAVLWIVNRGGGFTADLSSEMIAMFGFAIFIVAMGRILEQAAALKADNDAIV